MKDNDSQIATASGVSPAPFSATASGVSPASFSASDAEKVRTDPASLRSSWPFSLDTLRAATARYGAEAQETLIAGFRWCIDSRHPLSREDFAHRVDYSPILIYKILSGKYNHPETGAPLDCPDKLLKNIRDFLALELERYQSGQTEFIITPTAKKIFTACELGRESQSIVILSGPSHIGKTWALRHHAAVENHGRTCLAELEAASGLGGMIRQIAVACGISEKSNTAKLVERIKRALSPNTLLILDEVHLLKHTYRLNSFFACIETIRRIHDFSRCGMVLSWTNLDILRAHSETELVQIWRRGVHKIALPVMPTKADIAAILKHSGLDFPDPKAQVTVSRHTERPYEVLKQIAKRDGLKAITERLRYGRKLAARADVALTWSHVIDAHLRIEKESIPEPEWDVEKKG